MLVRYLLVGSAIGDCPLHRSMGAALDAGDAGSLHKALAQFESLPTEQRQQVLAGDPTPLDPWVDDGTLPGVESAPEPAKRTRSA